MRWVLRVLATGFLVGCIPFAPATFGSGVGAAIYWFLIPEASWFLALLVACLFALGLWLCGQLEETWGADDRRVVIDEICGVLVTFLLLPKSVTLLIAGFILFRLFDIVKPFPIRRSEGLGGGLGVMVDDVLAGLYANLTLRLGVLLFDSWKGV